MFAFWVLGWGMGFEIWEEVFGEFTEKEKGGIGLGVEWVGHNAQMFHFLNNC